MKLATIICNSMFLSVVCITSSSLCMQNLTFGDYVETDDPSLYATNDYLTTKIIPRTISNQLTLNSRSLFIGCHISQNALKIDAAPTTFCIKATNGVLYTFIPNMIGRHIQDENENWQIKTIIEKQKIKPAGSVIECTISPISEWLTNIKQNRKTIKNPPIQIDKYTHTTVYAKGPVLAECITLLSPNQYTKFLLKVINNNILVSQYKKDLLCELTNTHH